MGSKRMTGANDSRPPKPATDWETTINVIRSLETEIDRLREENRRLKTDHPTATEIIIMEQTINRLKDLLRESVEILDTIVPDTYAVGKMIHALSKWKQKAEKAIG
jgi:HAMP domain-containing protein